MNNLFEVATAKFDANGTGTTQLGPYRYGIVWNITRIITGCTTSNMLQVTFAVYKGFVSPTTQIGATYSGQQDSDDVSLSLGAGDFLIGQWTGGNAGDIGTMSVTGTFEDARR